MSFPETVDEILDVSEDEGEGPELGRTIPEICPLGQCGRQQSWGRALAFLPAGVGELCGPTVVLRRGRGEPARLLGRHLLARVLPCTVQERYAWTSPWSHAPGTVCREPLGMQSPPPCPAPRDSTSSQPGCSWPAPAPSHQDLTVASSYFAGTAHVTVMGMKCVPLPQLNGPFHPMATNHPHVTSIC